MYSQQKNLDDVNYKKFTSYLSKSDSVISLPDKFIIQNSVTLYSDSSFISSENYTIDYPYGKIRFTRAFFSGIISNENKNKAKITAIYKNYPFEIPDTYSKVEVLSRLDTLKEDTVKVANIKTDFIEDIFAGSDL